MKEQIKKIEALLENKKEINEENEKIVKISKYTKTESKIIIDENDNGTIYINGKLCIRFKLGADYSVDNAKIVTKNEGDLIDITQFILDETIDNKR